MKKLPLVVSILALAALVGAACGDDEEAEEAAGATVSLAADPDGLLAYDKKTVTAPAGSVTIDFDNPSPYEHDVVVVDADRKILDAPDGKEITRTDVTFEGDSDTATGEFKVGEYTYYCSVPRHLQAGMRGTLIIE